MENRACKPGRNSKEGVTLYCHEVKPVTEFYTIHTTQCKSCRSKQMKAARIAMRGSPKTVDSDIPTDHKKCVVSKGNGQSCGRILPVTAFRNGRSQCHECYLMHHREMARKKREKAGATISFHQPEDLPLGKMVCRLCEKQCDTSEMADHSRGGSGKRNICRICRNAQKKKR